MEIALATDDRYALACGVCITSILENNTDVYIHILTSGLSEKSILMFEQIGVRYSARINIIAVESSVFDGLKVSNRFPISIYYRLLLPQLLLAYDKVLYLDCDIIVNGSLGHLWSSPIDNYAAAVIEDQCSDDVRIRNRINIKHHYFNSGVMLMNLKYWRENSITQKCIDFLFDNMSICKYPDQDAMNHVIGDHVLYMDYGYNFQELMFESKDKLMLSSSKWEQIDKWINNPIVIHYTGKIKPWYAECSHPMKDLFIKYKAKSPLARNRVNRYYGPKENFYRFLGNVKRKLFG